MWTHVAIGWATWGGVFTIRMVRWKASRFLSPAADKNPREINALCVRI